jgi:rubredoxin
LDLLQEYGKITVKDGWAICPACEKKKLFPVRPDTELRKFEWKCPLCRQVYIVNHKAPVPASNETSA